MNRMSIAFVAICAAFVAANAYTQEAEYDLVGQHFRPLPRYQAEHSCSSEGNTGGPSLGRMVCQDHTARTAMIANPEAADRKSHPTK